MCLDLEVNEILSVENVILMKNVNGAERSEYDGPMMQLAHTFYL